MDGNAQTTGAAQQQSTADSSDKYEAMRKKIEKLRNKIKNDDESPATATPVVAEKPADESQELVSSPTESEGADLKSDDTGMRLYNILLPLPFLWYTHVAYTYTFSRPSVAYWLLFLGIPWYLSTTSYMHVNQITSINAIHHVHV